MLAGLLLATSAIAAIADDRAVGVADAANQPALIAQLESTKEIDWKEARDPSVSPMRHESFLNQMNKVDLVLKKLNHGVAVPQSEIDDALFVPPKHITPDLRASLIDQLEQRRQQVDQKEQEMLNGLAWGRSSAPADTEIFEERKAEIDHVLQDLEIGAPVHWTAIHQALAAAPSSPY
jgi:hypothetical protein